MAPLVQQALPVVDGSWRLPIRRRSHGCVQAGSLPVLMRRFRLHRELDVSGVSGIGDVAEGVQFADGTVAVRWLGSYPSTAVWASIDAVIAVHGHNGTTRVEWLDEEAA